MNGQIDRLMGSEATFRLFDVSDDCEAKRGRKLTVRSSESTELSVEVGEVSKLCSKISNQFRSKSKKATTTYEA